MAMCAHRIGIGVRTVSGRSVASSLALPLYKQGQGTTIQGGASLGEVVTFKLTTDSAGTEVRE